MGLTICARLVSLMGGTLQMDSEAGVGSRFWLSLAFERCAASDDPARAAMLVERDPTREGQGFETDVLAGVQVLVAEDDPVNRLVVRDLLADQGAVVTLATTGAEAVSLAAHGHFDIALMDIQMPEMDGIAACRRIRALEAGGDLPIIALSARTLGDEREQCTAAGMNGYLAKPLEPQRLFDELCRWFAAPAAARTEPPPGDEIVQPSAPVPVVPILSGFDETVVRRWHARHPKWYARAIRTFLAEWGEAVSSIEAALDAGRCEQAADQLHRLRGAAGVLAGCGAPGGASTAAGGCPET